MRPNLEPRQPTQILHNPTPNMAPPQTWPGPGWPWPVANAPRSQGGTDRAVVGPRLRSVDRPVQAGPADVDIEGLGEGFQQLQQRPWVHIVVVIHMAEPPVGMEGANELGGGSQGLPASQTPPVPPSSVNEQLQGGGGSHVRPLSCTRLHLV